jgi:LCP family protein required for cell wall assembly
MSRRNDGDDPGWSQPRSRRGRRRSRPPSRLASTGAHSMGYQVAAWTSVALVGVLVAGSLVAYGKYRSIWDSIKRVDVAGLIGQQPPKYTNAENILVLGTDTRVNQGGIGGNSSVGCDCSDTIMLLHISPGRHRVTVMSVPRETMVPVMACAASDGTPGQQAEEGQVELINATLSAGGPACTWKTFASVTGIHIDHFIELDFTGFEKVIDDLGGVNICLPFSVDISQSGLHLAKGEHHVFGPEALAFWRTREGVGFGSDTQRILRDQYLMVALVQGIEKSRLLTSPTKVLKVVTDTTDAMTTDTGLDQNAMLQIADSLKGIKSSDVSFVTSPNVPDPDNNNNVVFQQPQADQLFNAIAHDNTLPSASKGKNSKGKKKPKKTAPPALDTSPSQIKVEVENGSGTSGEASQAGSELTTRGFQVVSTGDANNFDYTSAVIEYAGPSDLSAVNTLKALLPSDTQTQPESSLTPGTLVLIIGSEFSGFSASSASPSQSASPAPSIQSATHAAGALSGSARICKDQQAFAGPDSSG